MGQSKHYTKGIDSKGTLSYRIVTMSEVYAHNKSDHMHSEVSVLNGLLPEKNFR